MREQIIRTFEHLLHSRSKSSSSKQPRTFYRVNHDKLEKYRNENHFKCNRQHLLTEEKQLSYVEAEQAKNMALEVLPGKVIHQKTISTQTTFSTKPNSSTDFLHSTANASVVSKSGKSFVLWKTLQVLCLFYFQ